MKNLKEATNTMKKLFSVILALIISMSIATTAFAAEDSKCYSINFLSDGTCYGACCNPEVLEYEFSYYKGETASTWAQEPIKQLIRMRYMGLWDVNTDGVFNYKSDIQRQEFMVMVIGYVSRHTNKSLNDLVDLAIPSSVLEDGDFTRITFYANTYSPYMVLSKWIGISDGTRYKDSLTREEAATLIMRAVNAVEIINNAKGPLYEIADLTAKVQATISAPDASFADGNTISSWAKNGVNFVASNGIMGGTGGNNFSPKSNYTVEQAIVTLSRIIVE